MSDFQMKISIDGINIELQGDAEVVYKIFSDLREAGLGELTKSIESGRKNVQSQTTNVVEANKDEEEYFDEPAKFPSIDELKLTDPFKNEAEWVLAYIGYASDFGKSEVTRDDVMKYYDTSGRKNSNRLGNYNTNLSKLVKKKLVSIINDGVYSITTAGLQNLNNIINDTSSVNKKTKKTSKNQKSTPLAATKYEYIELGFDADEIVQIKQFYEDNKSKVERSIDKILLAFEWARKNKSVSILDTNTTYTLLTYVEEDATFNIPATFSNAENRYNYVKSSAEKGKFIVTALGDKRIKELTA